jgi:hypothetical protein
MTKNIVAIFITLFVTTAIFAKSTLPKEKSLFN